ncbi:hypothetical protein CJJ07_000587 [Candidozyma auris]|nr:hypothetical protein CJJ07_000587 [[Candida] auris]QEL60597.1 hypothetical protein CJJ09_002710 [[Candida] auris]
MSSIVKKSSQFTPKLRKRSERAKKLSSLTPPTTQEAQAGSEPSQLTQPEEAGISTPPTTQKSQDGHSDLSKFTMGTGKSPSVERPGEADAEVVDPKDATKKTHEEAVEDESDEHEYGDNDYFKNTLTEADGKASRRRSSVASRRLSGIFNRSGSVSTPGPIGIDKDDSRVAPTMIGIPTVRPSKKSKVSISKSSKKQQLETVVAVPTNQPLLEEEETEPISKEDQKKDTVSSATALGQDFVVGIDPVTNRFMKFRTHEGVSSELPVAPKNLITTVTDIRQLPRKVAAEDEKYYANLRVSADKLTIADLCKPLIQIGTTSEKFHIAEQAKKKIMEARDLRRNARNRARNERISYEKALQIEQTKASNTGQTQNGTGPTEITSEVTQQDPNTAASTNNIVVEMTDGKLQVSDESMIRKNNPVPSAGSRKVEVENPFDNPITSNSYTKSAYTDAWTKEELVQLYNALSTWGTDFTFIAQLFPHRNRRQIKRKFTLEEKKRPELVELALRRKLPPDLESYCRLAADGKEFKTLDDLEKEIKQLREEHEKHMNEIQSEREKAIKEDLEASRKREMEIRTGSRMMTRAERERELRKNEIVVGTVDSARTPHLKGLKGET